jgi:hypothetical protein
MSERCPGVRTRGSVDQSVLNAGGAHSRTPFMQPKLTISASRDRLEQDADRIADQVLALPAHPTVRGAPPRIQRVSGQLGRQADAAPGSVDRVLASPGRSMEPALQEDMQQRFGHDFSRVRVHSGGAAEQSAREVNADAYTVGHHIVFGAGQLAPGPREGRRLIAHELTHVVQQESGVDQITGLIQRYESPEHQDLGDKYLEELFDFIQREDGEKWAKEHGIDPRRLVQDIAQDPVRRNKAIKVRPGLELTPGQIISLMGDFYATWKELQHAPKEEIDRLLAVMAKERASGVDANVEYEKITQGRYTKLARVNTKHFAPKNRDAWQDLHLQAMAKARQAATDKDSSLDGGSLSHGCGRRPLPDGRVRVRPPVRQRQG